MNKRQRKKNWIGEFGVTCKACRSNYKNMVPWTVWRGHQGVDCAATVYWDQDTKNWKIECYYGSDFDTSIFVFYAEPEPRYRNACPICDRCIFKLTESGKITFESNYEL